MYLPKTSFRERERHVDALAKIKFALSRRREGTIPRGSSGIDTKELVSPAVLKLSRVVLAKYLVSPVYRIFAEGRHREKEIESQRENKKRRSLER